MSIKPLPLLIAALFACAGSTAYADDSGADTPPADRVVRVTMAPGSEFVIPGAGPLTAIKNAPYSADIIKERQQILGDGNQILQRDTARSYRDSAGRTREEVMTDKGDVRSIVIVDPVAGLRWMLYPQAKTAMKMKLPVSFPTRVLTAPPDQNVHVLERRIQADGTEQMSMKSLPGTDDSGTQGTPGKFKMEIIPNRGMAAPVRSVVPGMNTLLATAVGDMKWARQATRRDLGTREFDGVKAQGRLRSYEIPAGELGNRNAIVVSDETWFSADLRVTLSSKHSDPRTGDSLFRVENLKREEPALALFAPPADYTVVDRRLPGRDVNRKPD